MPSTVRLLFAPARARSRTLLVAAFMTGVLTSPAAAQRAGTSTSPLQTDTRTPAQVATEMRQAGSAALDVARRISTELRADARTSAAAMRQAGYSAAENAGALADALATRAEESLPFLLVAGYDGRDAGRAVAGKVRDVTEAMRNLQRGGIEGAEAVSALLWADVPTPTLGTVATSVYSLTAYALAQSLRNNGKSIQEIAAALAAAGHGITVIGQTLKGMGHTATEVAVAVASLGHQAQQVATMLHEIGYSANEMAEALVNGIGVHALPLASIFKHISIGAHATAGAFHVVGIGADLTAQAMLAAGYAAVETGAGLVAAGATVEAAAAALHAAGASVNDVVSFLADRGRTASQAAGILKAMGIPLDVALPSLQSVFNQSLENAFQLAGPLYTLAERVGALQALGKAAHEIATLLKDGGTSPSEIYKALRTHLGLDADAAAKALKQSEHTAVETANAMFILESQMMNMMKAMHMMMQAMMAAGYSKTEIAGALAPLFNMTVEAVQAALAALSP